MAYQIVSIIKVILEHVSVSLLSFEQLTTSGYLLKHLILFTPDFYKLYDRKLQLNLKPIWDLGMVGLEATVVQSPENKCCDKYHLKQCQDKITCVYEWEH